jgi:hypothetical protein
VEEFYKTGSSVNPRIEAKRGSPSSAPLVIGGATASAFTAQ